MILLICLGDVETAIDILSDRSRLPSVGQLRPAICPGCKHPAYPSGPLLGIVGHGSYKRMVLCLTHDTVVIIRRYLCRGCGGTISVLADVIHPGRWYAAGVILEAIRRHLDGESETNLIKAFAPHIQSGRWRSLYRWSRQLGQRLFAWLARRLGFQGPTKDRSEVSARLVRLLAEADMPPTDISRRNAGFQAAKKLLGIHPAHRGGMPGILGRAPPEM